MSEVIKNVDKFEYFVVLSIYNIPAVLYTSYGEVYEVKEWISISDDLVMFTVDDELIYAVPIQNIVEIIVHKKDILPVLKMMGG